MANSARLVNLLDDNVGRADLLVIGDVPDSCQRLPLYPHHTLYNIIRFPDAIR